jgi:transcriptional regulator with XRE-family HTH domain
MATRSSRPPENAQNRAVETPPGEEVGRRVRRAREAVGLSQAALGELLGYKASMISAFENGSRRLKLEDLTRLCVALDKEPEYFLRTKAVRDAQHRPVALRAELADLRNEALYESISKFLDHVDAMELPEGRVPDLHQLRPERAARDLLDACGVDGPEVELPAIAKELGVILIGWEFPASLSALVVDIGDGDGQYVIAFNTAKRHSERRQRFSIAHELGHAVLRHPATHYLEFFDPEFGEPPGVRPSDEREANQFAAALLMDARWLREDWARGEHNVSKLAKRYNVSEEAMGFRVTNLGLS